MHTSTQAHAHIHARKHASTRTHAHASTRTHAHTRTHTYREHSTCLLYHSRALLLILIETLGSLLVKLSLHFWDSLIYSNEAKAAHYIT